MAAPPTKPGYQDSFPQQYGSPSYAPPVVPMWLDPTDTTLDPAGKPTPVSPGSPFPVTITGGSTSGGSTTANQGSQAGTQSGNEWYVQDITTRSLLGSLVGGVSTSAKQPALNGDGGALAHITNLPATQPVTGTVTVQGGAAVGSPPAVPPVPVSGVDTTGNKQHLLTDTSGRQYVVPPSGSGTDAGGAQPAVGNVLSTFTVATPGAYYVQNQSAVTLQVIFDNGTSGGSVQLLGPGAGAGSQGGDTAPAMAWFTGRVRVAGPAGSQFMARSN